MEKKLVLTARVLPRSRTRGVEKISEREYRIRVLSPPSKGAANEETIEVLASYLSLPKSRLKLVGGASSRIKRIEILGKR